MKRFWMYALGLMAALPIAGAAAEPPTGFATLDYPGAAGTQAWGINPHGTVVGVYTAADKTSHGFVWNNNRYTGVDYPESALTLANGINPQGDVVGEYSNTYTGPHHGFLLTAGKFISLDYPNASATGAIGINARGDILGYYTMTDNLSHAFLLSGGKFTGFDYPGATQTIPNGMNSLGEVVGGYVIAGVSHAFLLSGGKFTSFDFPGAVFTNAVGINPRGDIVGRYRDSAGVTHAYLLSHGQFTAMDAPNATFTGATSISPSGDIVGRYIAAGLTHGFLMQGSGTRYIITDLGPVGPGQPLSIPNNGAVAGAAAVDGGAEHAVVWSKGNVTDLGTLGVGVSNSLGFSMNENGQVVGQAETLAGDPNHEDFCGFQSLGLPSWGKRCLPFIWQKGVMRALPLLGGNNGVASWINSGGDVVGTAENTTVDPGCPAPQKLQFKPVIWQNGSVQELPTITGDPNGIAIAIGDNGIIVGGTGNCSTFSPQLLFKLQPLHAVKWEKGVLTDLGTLGGSGHGSGNIALDINQQGEIVGNSDLPGDATGHAFLWTKAKGMQDLGTLPGDVTSAGISINDSSEVVGVSLDASFNLHPYHWQDGQMQDLNGLVANETSLSLILACSINDRGEITGLAIDTRSGEPHGFVAAPTSGQPAAAAHSATRAVALPMSAHVFFARYGVRLTAPRR